MVAVTYKRWSFTKDYNYASLAGKNVVFWISGCFREVVIYRGLTVVYIVVYIVGQGITGIWTNFWPHRVGIWTSQVSKVEMPRGFWGKKGDCWSFYGNPHITSTTGPLLTLYHILHWSFHCWMKWADWDKIVDSRCEVFHMFSLMFNTCPIFPGEKCWCTCNGTLGGGGEELWWGRGAGYTYVGYSLKSLVYKCRAYVC